MFGGVVGLVLRVVHSHTGRRIRLKLNGGSEMEDS